MYEYRHILALVLAAGVASACASIEIGKGFRELDYPLETRILEVDGVEVAYHEAGQGEQTLLLIHGLGSYLPAWKNNVAALAEHYRVVAIDLPGFGRSSKANYHYSMRFFSRVVDAVIDGLELGNPVLVGHSMGGQIALTHALDYPGKAKALILTAPAGLEGFSEGEVRWFKRAVTPRLIMGAGPKAIHTNFARNFNDMPADAEFMIRHRLEIIKGPDFESYAYANSRAVAAMVDGPTLDKHHEVEVPVFVIYGEDDELIPSPFLHPGETRDIGEVGVEAFPNARLEMIPDAGHMVHFERPELYNQLVLEFLSAL